MFTAEIVKTEGTTYMIYYRDDKGSETQDTIINWEFDHKAFSKEYRQAIEVLNKAACNDLIKFLKKIK
jgi:hypothetical protein